MELIISYINENLNIDKYRIYICGDSNDVYMTILLIWIVLIFFIAVFPVLKHLEMI